MFFTLSLTLSCSSGEVDVEELVKNEKSYLAKRQEIVKNHQKNNKSQKGDVITVKRSSVPGY